jgi:hypothetical protein
MEKRFLELAQNKDISDEDLFEELCYLYAKSHIDTSKDALFSVFKLIRTKNPSLTLNLKIPEVSHLYLLNPVPKYIEQFDHKYYFIEKYEMKQRIQSLEQTLAAFMEQTRAERLSQEATIQSLSKELDEFQEEFYDCQSELKEHVGLMEDALKEAVENVLELHQLKEEREHLVLKYKTA